MSEKARRSNSKPDHFDLMRSILAISKDLTRNELAVLLAYAVERDNKDGKVKGKSQDRIRATIGLSRTQFQVAIAGLKSKGLLTINRHRKGCATVLLDVPEDGHSRCPVVRGPGNQRHRDVPEDGISGCPGERALDDIYPHGTELEDGHSVPTGGCCIAQGGEFSEGTSAGAAPDTDTRQGPFPAKGVVSHQGRTHSRERNIDGHEPTIEGTYAHDGRAGWEPLPCWEVAA